MNIKGCLFDFGVTIAKESNFNFLKGMKEVLKYATCNPNKVTEHSLFKLYNILEYETNRKRGYIEKLKDLEYPESIFKIIYLITIN